MRVKLPTEQRRLLVETPCEEAHQPSYHFFLATPPPPPLPKSRAFSKASLTVLLLLAVMDATTAFWSTSPQSSNKPSHGSSSTLLVPSQVRQKTPSKSKSSASTKPSKRTVSSYHTFLVPSQVLKAHPGSAESSSSSSSPSSASPLIDDAPIVPGRSHPNQKRNRRRKKKVASIQAVANATQHSSKSKPAKSGNLPDVYWRSIPLEHLRQHPNYEPLPLPETIQTLDSLEDIRIFRQESWQWDAVHEGRCTTSQAVAALGFLEKEAGKILGIPQSWLHGGMGAYHRLRKPALRTLEKMNELLCRNNSSVSSDGGAETPKDPPNVWKTPGQDSFPFAAKYMIRMNQDDVEERKKLSKTLSKTRGFDFSVRMMWGNAQEATSLLTALNYFASQDNGIILKEVGMCGGGLKTNHTNGGASSLLLGATPDGLLCHPDGTVEAVEVKNHCPFFPIQSYQQRTGTPHGHKGKRFCIRHFDIQNAGVPSQYIPQLMMEMFCVGENCRSSIMVRQTATSGSLVLRVHRDDAWIEEMLYWLHRFQQDFVEREEPPPPNFFLQGSSETDSERYANFLQKTKELQAKLEVVAHIPHSQIQRAMAIRPGMANLFLD
jgi:hypothetical protein